MRQATQSLLLDQLVRMVVPMRREFHCSLDVQAFLHDTTYAGWMLAQALGSHEERLRAYARRVDRLLQGEPGGGKPPLPGAALPQSVVAAPATTPARPAGAAAACNFTALRRDAAKRLIDSVGPPAEALAIRIERAADTQALQQVLQAAAKLVRAARGAAPAHAFALAVGLANSG